MVNEITTVIDIRWIDFRLFLIDLDVLGVYKNKSKTHIKQFCSDYLE